MDKRQLVQAIQAALFRGMREETSRVYTIDTTSIDALRDSAEKIKYIEEEMQNFTSPKQYGESLKRRKRRK